MTAIQWRAFPYEAKDYGYEGAALGKAWNELHRGHCEPFPDAAFVARAFARHPKLEGKLDAERTAAALQSAWRAYHRGDFAVAVAEGTALGPIGANAANKAANIYATYLETDRERKREILLQSADRAEALQAAAPDFVNAFYFHAQALGRYSQEISIMKALAQGIGHKVKASLERAIKLEPNHAEAHLALGAYHAEVVSKVGRNAREPHLRGEQGGGGASISPSPASFCPSRRSPASRRRTASSCCSARPSSRKPRSFTRKPRNASPPTQCRNSTQSMRARRPRGDSPSPAMVRGREGDG